MDGRGKRSRAGTVETRPASHTSSFSGGRRPDLSDKHNSAPVSARQREGYSKRSSGPTTNHDLRQSKKSNIPEENVASVTSDQLRNSKTDSRSSHVCIKQALHSRFGCSDLVRPVFLEVETNLFEYRFEITKKFQ